MHWLTRFDDVDLSQFDANFNAGPAPAGLALAPTIGGGVFDADGSGASRQRFPVALRYACTVVGPDAATARARVDAIKAKIGTRAKLWRTMIDDGETQWAWARLSDIDDTMRARMPKWLIPVTLSFSVTSRWHGLQHDGGWVLDAGEVLDDGLALDGNEKFTLSSTNMDLVVDNDGNLPVRDAILRITAGTTTLTVLQVGVSGVSEIKYAGSLAAGDVLEIDCGARSILNDGANAYSGFSFTANHKTADWLTLQPGNTTVNVKRTGGGATSTIEFVFSDGWA